MTLFLVLQVCTTRLEAVLAGLRFAGVFYYVFLQYRDLTSCYLAVDGFGECLCFTRRCKRNSCWHLHRSPSSLTLTDTLLPDLIIVSQTFILLFSHLYSRLLLPRDPLRTPPLLPSSTHWVTSRLKSTPTTPAQQDLP